MNTRKTARELALDLCGRSPCKEQMAAVLSDNHGIFAWGWNHVNIDAKMVGSGVHAEAHAISRANRRRLGGAMLTVAGKRKMSFLLSKPCLKCLALAMKHGITAIEYLTKSGEWKILKLTYQKT